MHEFRGQVAVITGGAKGLGLGIAKRLGEGGAKIAIADVYDTEGGGAKHELANLDIDSIFMRCDVGEETDVEKSIKEATDQWRWVDILVNNTGIVGHSSAEHVQYMLDKIPMKRFGKVEELTNLVAWIASRECSFCTGFVFDLSGGRATY